MLKIGRNFITIRVVGGLGNQLFGAIFGLFASSHSGLNLKIDGTFVGFGSNPTRKLEINQFDFRPFEILFKGVSEPRKSLINRSEIARKAKGRVLRIYKRSISENQVESSFVFKPGQKFTGYFHTWEFADKLFELYPKFQLELKEKSSIFIQIENDLQKARPICVHVRLGDFLIHKDKYSFLPQSYFLAAIKVIRETHPNSEVWIFVESESELAKYYPVLKESAKRIIDQSFDCTDAEIFSILSSSKFLVTSNSTFSLWAAWFVEKSGSLAIVPNFGSSEDSNTRLLDGRWDSINVFSNKLITKSKVK